MSSAPMKRFLPLLTFLVLPAWAQDSGKPVYRCPGNPILYTDSLSPKEAKAKNCRTLEGAPITVIQSVRPRDIKNGMSSAEQSYRGEGRIDPSEQRSRDSDAKKILQAELQKEEEQLAAIQKEYNNGEPERHGSEQNFQKYLDRTSELKASIMRKEGDIAAIKRELGKLP